MGPAGWIPRLAKEAISGSNCRREVKFRRKQIMVEGPVLLVEDDPSDVRLIQRAFGKLELNIAVMRLTNGEEAVAYLSGDSPFDNRAAYPMPSIVLLDIKLPRRSGFEVLEW